MDHYPFLIGITILALISIAMLIFLAGFLVSAIVARRRYVDIALKAVHLRLERLEEFERIRQAADRVDSIGDLKVGHRAWIRRLDAEACEGSAYVRRTARAIYDEDVALDDLGAYFLVRRTDEGLAMEVPDPRSHEGPIRMAAAHFLFDTDRAMRIENAPDIEPIREETCVRQLRPGGDSSCSMS